MNQENDDMAEDHREWTELSKLPRTPIDTLTEPFKHFLHIEASSGVVLLVAAMTALILANSPFADGFLAFWKTKIGFKIGAFEEVHSLQHWINDGLMAVFFFVVGLEVKRELVLGELRDLKTATLPIAAAVGGMIVPACVYLSLQYGQPGEPGWGIPMATDIAFVVGCLAILGRRIPRSLRVMLLSLAIADDIGAILVIAIGYTDNLNIIALILAVVGVGITIGMMKLGIQNMGLYLLVMVLVWYAFHESGIHATIAGVIFGFLTPAKPWISQSRLKAIVEKVGHFLQGGEWEGPKQRYRLLRKMELASRETICSLERFEHELHPWSAFYIMPVFALANAGVAIELSDFKNPLGMAVMLGLVVGKPLGIVLFSWLAVKLGLARLPEEISWGMVTGAGFLAGIGFTMAIFIASLALGDNLLDAAKVGIIIGSVVSGIAGVVLLVFFTSKPEGAGHQEG
jgi:NhaA family Na+:H+ antiporter